MLLLLAQHLLSLHYRPKDVMSTRTWRDGRGLLVKVHDILFADSTPPSKTAPFSPSAPSAPSKTMRSAANDHSPLPPVHPSEYFSRSKDPRLDRSPIQFRVGQVIRHKVYGYRGIIVGWDTVAKAPQDWYNRMHVSESKRRHPFYSVLVDTRDRGPQAQTTYVWQGNIMPYKQCSDASRIEHPKCSPSLRTYPLSFFHYYELSSQHVPV
eukprot:gene1769-4882_t